MRSLEETYNRTSQQGKPFPCEHLGNGFSLKFVFSFGGGKWQVWVKFITFDVHSIRRARMMLQSDNTVKDPLPCFEYNLFLVWSPFLSDCWALSSRNLNLDDRAPGDQKWSLLSTFDGARSIPDIQNGQPQSSCGWPHPRGRGRGPEFGKTCSRCGINPFDAERYDEGNHQKVDPDVWRTGHDVQNHLGGNWRLDQTLAWTWSCPILCFIFHDFSSDKNRINVRSSFLDYSTVWRSAIGWASFLNLCTWRMHTEIASRNRGTKRRKCRRVLPLCHAKAILFWRNECFQVLKFLWKIELTIEQGQQWVNL